jgi:hypothetical protein
MAVRQGLPGSLAARVTYLLEPKNWLIVTVVGIGADADGLAGAAWGLLAAFFAAVLPTVFISYGIRRGRWEDRNVGARRARLVVLGVHHGVGRDRAGPAGCAGPGWPSATTPCRKLPPAASSAPRRLFSPTRPSPLNRLAGVSHASRRVLELRGIGPL